MDTIDEELVALGAVLVEQRVLRRIIKNHRKVRGFGLQVPHEDCYTIARGDLGPLVESDEIAVPLDTLPEALAVVHGDRELLAKSDAAELVRLWRTLFHARLHQALDARGLTAGGVRARVQRVGQTQFDEIRSVLVQEDLLLPPVDPVSTYVEFAALYLELRHFAPDTLARTFPAVFDQMAIDATLALDVDAEALLAATRPPRAPARPILDVVDEVPDEEEYRDLVQPSARKGALVAQSKGNHVRAAILFARAGDHESASAELEVISTQLAQAIGVTSQAWTAALLPVASYAAGHRSLWFNPGARLLYDLQAAAMVPADEVKVVDVLGWILSRGKDKIVRALPATREVRIARHVHAAVAKIVACRLPRPQDRVRLSRTVQAIEELAETHLRATLRPTIEAALDAVELHPYNLPERVGEKNLIDGLLDRAVAIGRLTLGDLRDAVSRNDLKMPDLALEDLGRGDQLLRMDRMLATSNDGVYRRGESYMRGLQKVSSVLFGTRIGRFLTLYFLLPLLVSYATVEGLQHMVGPVVHKLFDVELVIATTTSLLAGAAFVFLLLHVPPFRHAMYLGVRGLWRVTRLLLFDLPLAALRIPVVRWLLASRFVRWVVKPALPAVIVWLCTPMLIEVLRWSIAGAVFLIAMAFLNSRMGRRAEEIALDFLVRSSRQVTSRVVPGLVSWTLELFGRLVERFDRFLYRVDEWLRFRTGQSKLKLVFKGIAGTIWGVITYFLRLYVNLFIEPTTNPIKHFPVVTVAAKIMLPFIPAMLTAITGATAVILGTQLARGFAAFTVLVLPGLAGFLVWELKENWNLYQRARSKTLNPLAIGHHGETMVRLMRPGFHSGTIPKLFTKLRRAAWRHDPGASARAMEGLHGVEEALHLFVDRQLVLMLDESVAFKGNDVATKRVQVGSNRIVFDLVCPSISDETTSIRFDMQSGWLVASIHAMGWVARLSPGQREIFEIALAGFYALADVDIVREQIEAALLEGAEARAPRHGITDEGIVVWPDGTYETEIVYKLHSSRPAPIVRGAPYTGPVVDLLRRRALFGREHLYWATWSTMWQRLARGEEPQPVIAGPSLLSEW